MDSLGLELQMLLAALWVLAEPRAPGRAVRAFYL